MRHAEEVVDLVASSSSQCAEWSEERVSGAENVLKQRKITVFRKRLKIRSCRRLKSSELHGQSSPSELSSHQIFPSARVPAHLSPSTQRAQSIEAGPKVFVKRKQGQVSSGMKRASYVAELYNQGFWVCTHTSSDAFTTSVAAGGNPTVELLRRQTTNGERL